MKKTLKGHLLWKIHFCMVFENKCVLAVCEQLFFKLFSSHLPQKHLYDK